MVKLWSRCAAAYFTHKLGSLCHVKRANGMRQKESFAQKAFLEYIVADSWNVSIGNLIA
jgi:hypothetical protein